MGSTPTLTGGPLDPTDKPRDYSDFTDILKHTPETEDTWSLLTDAIRELDAISKQCTFPEGFLDTIQGLSNDIKALLTSSKIILVATTLDFIRTLGVKLSPADFMVYESEFIPSILTLILRGSQSFQLRARECIITLLQHKKVLNYAPSVIAGFFEGNEFGKCSVMEILVEYVQCFGTKFEPYLGLFEDLLRAGYTDESQDVRGVVKRVFDAYRRQFKDRAESLKLLFDQDSEDESKTHSPSLPSLCAESEYDSDHVLEVSVTSLRSGVSPKFVRPLEPITRKAMHLTKHSPVASYSSGISKLTVPCEELPYMKLTQAYLHRLSQTTLDSETSSANFNHFPLSLRVYPVSVMFPNRKPFRV